MMQSGPTGWLDFPEFDEDDEHHDCQVQDGRPIYSAQRPRFVFKTDSAGHSRVKTKSEIALRTGISEALQSKVSVHENPVSREMYSVGAKNNTATMVSGTSEAGVPSLRKSARPSA